MSDQRIQNIREWITRTAAGQPDDAALAGHAVDLAGQLLIASRRTETFAEKQRAARLARMMEDVDGKSFTLAMADQVFRPPAAATSARRFRDLLARYGVPEYLPLHERIGIQAASVASLLAPEIVMPAITGTMRAQSRAVILPAADAKRIPLLRKRHRLGMRMNLNLLGEAILGENEAAHRTASILASIADPNCNYLSVKISAIFSQIHLVGREPSLELITDRLREIYRAAIANPFQNRPKFINLDMEEYRDLHLTCDAFMRLLDEEEFRKLRAGIVLQAYLPDAWTVQQTLNDWASARLHSGGAEIKIRIVKGANLAMESVDAELHDWPCAVFPSKLEVDANFKRMLHEACRPRNAEAVRIGLASHNLFDIAYALLLREREGVPDRIEFEMLEGMANHQARIVNAVAGGLLLYAPVVRGEDFHCAIAYLVRRLDENTSEENFLRDSFGMRIGDAAWENQRSRFLASCAAIDHLASGPRRTQDRSRETFSALPVDAPFENVADTDWSLPQNSAWARELLESAQKQAAVEVPLVIAGRECRTPQRAATTDPSRPGTIVCHHSLAGFEEIEQALEAAVAARAGWLALGTVRRAALLRATAAGLANARGEAIAVMAAEAGKAPSEADPEISEAIDFANYYAHRALMDEAEIDGAKSTPLGTVLITPPWNFPFAIPCGGILAALVSGNTVILKPAPEVVLTAWKLAEILWAAGIPRDVLQFVPCPDTEVGRALVTDPRVSAVVLTGAYETARMFLGWQPQLHLLAETSGKNALLITDTADPDQAIKDLVKSAFGHSGQKCSAASLAIVVAERYDHVDFLRQLRDAAASLVTGGTWRTNATVTPLARPPEAALERALTTLDPGEEWLLEPRMLEDNPCMWTPGIKIGVRRDSWFHRTECFGPVLGIIRAESLEHAIEIQNDSPFGLTGGIHSLDQAEITTWLDRVEVGNAYVNRPITGAIVRRQPFGGWKRSCSGPGAKAGGPNYLGQFSEWENLALPVLGRPPTGIVPALLDALRIAVPHAAAWLAAAAASDRYWLDHEFLPTHDPSRLRSEANEFRYRKFPGVVIRVTPATDEAGLARLLLIAAAMDAPTVLSIDAASAWLPDIAAEIPHFEIIEEPEHRFTLRLPELAASHPLLRAPQPSAAIAAACTAVGIRLAATPVLANARREWPAWLREQSISRTLHRYGNLIAPPSQGVASAHLQDRKSR